MKAIYGACPRQQASSLLTSKRLIDWRFLGRLRGAVASRALVGALLLAPIVAGLWPCTAAQAVQAHSFSDSFAGPGEAAGELGLVDGSASTAGSGVGVNDEAHTVFVADTANNRVDEFSSAGSFIRAWGWGVTNGAEELQTCTSSCRAGRAGLAPGQLEAPTFVAVDNDPASPSHGDVYVAGPGKPGESTANLVTKFSAEGALDETWGASGQLSGSSAPEGPFGEITGIAVDPSGKLWVYGGPTSSAQSRVHMFVFEAAGAFSVGWTPEKINPQYSPQGIAVNGTGDVFVSNKATSVEKLGPKGEWLGVVAEANLVSGFGANTSGGDLYFGEGGTSVAYIPQCVPLSGGCSRVQTFGPPELNEAVGIAVDAGDGTVYAANAGDDQIAVFTVAGEATSTAPEAVEAHGAVMRGTVNPDGAQPTRCVFEYGLATERSFSASAPCDKVPAEIGSGATPVEVSAPTSLLEGGTNYRYRLRMTNADVRSNIETFITKTTPAIEEVTATEVEPTAVKLVARINPDGLAASYHFEYDTAPYRRGEAAHGTSVPVPDESIGAGTTGVVVSQRLSGLVSNTTYHYRVTSNNANGASTSEDGTFFYRPLGPYEVAGDCPNESVRQEADRNPETGLSLSAELPDCRALELVSPPQKNAALLVPVLFGLNPQVASGGERVLTSSVQCFESAQSCTGDRASKGPPFEFTRTDTGWDAVPLAPPASSFEINSVWGYDADNGLVLYSSPVASHVTDEFYAREPDGSMDGIGPIAENQSFASISSSALHATADLSHVVYESGRQGSLWPSFDHGERNSVYEYSGVGNSRPFMVGVKGSKNGAGVEEAGSKELISVCGTAIGSEVSAAVPEAISSDGRIVYFTAEGPCAGGSGVNHATAVPASELYARVDGETSEAHTVAISDSQCGSGAQAPELACREAELQPAGAFFEGASEDGSVGVFTSTQQLTDTASEDSQSEDSADVNGCAKTKGPNGCNLYLYDLTAPLGSRLVDVSAGDSSGDGPQVQGVMAVSTGGTHVYFVARGVLTPGKNHAGGEAIAGGDNLYLYERGTAHPNGRTVFIATLPGAQSSPPRNELPETSAWSRLGGGTRANVTPDGRLLVFSSHGALTADTTRREGPAQIFRYNAETEELQRISIGQRGFNDNGNAGEGEARVVENEGTIGQPRRDQSMSDDGAYVFFQSPVGLTPGALNNVSINGGTESEDLAENIYEWEEDGSKGGCEQQSGCVHLISDGRDVAEGNNGGAHTTNSTVELLGSDATGENVFFTTADPLVEQDTDTQLDIYDARVGGGFPAPSAEVQCQGEACRASSSPSPAFAPLGSSSFAGAGNLASPPVKPTVKPVVKPPTRAQKLAKALKQCRSKRNKRKRASCERQARKKYGPKPKAKQNGKGVKRTASKGKRK
jgi:hypothetical protein